MQSLRVKDIMVPTDEYTTVSKDATLYEAIKVLGNAQAEFSQEKNKHRIHARKPQSAQQTSSKTQQAHTQPRFAATMSSFSCISRRCKNMLTAAKSEAQHI